MPERSVMSDRFSCLKKFVISEKFFMSEKVDKSGRGSHA